MGVYIMKNKDITNYWYSRVSTGKQDLERQNDMAKELDIPEANIYIDKCNANTPPTARPGFSRMMDNMKCGDILHVESLDRISRSELVGCQCLSMLEDKQVFLKINFEPEREEIGKEFIDVQNTEDKEKCINKFRAIEVESKKLYSRTQYRNAKRPTTKKSKNLGGRPTKDLPPNYHNILDQLAKGLIKFSECLNLLDICKQTFYNKGLDDIVKGMAI